MHQLLQSPLPFITIDDLISYQRLHLYPKHRHVCRISIFDSPLHMTHDTWPSICIWWLGVNNKAIKMVPFFTADLLRTSYTLCTNPILYTWQWYLTFDYFHHPQTSKFITSSFWFWTHNNCWIIWTHTTTVEPVPFQPFTIPPPFYIQISFHIDNNTLMIMKHTTTSHIGSKPFWKYRNCPTPQTQEVGPFWPFWVSILFKVETNVVIKWPNLETK